MASGPPEYQERAQLGEGPTPGLRGVQAPSMPVVNDGSQVWKSVSGFGQEMAQVTVRLQAGTEQTQVSEGMERFLGERDKIRDQYVKDSDYENAESKARDALEKAKLSGLENITNPQLRAQASLQMERSALSAANDVRTAQFARQKDINIAGNDAMGQRSLTEATTATSLVERQAAIDRYSADLTRLYGAGWIDAQTAQGRFKSFSGQLEMADATKLVRDNPKAAVEALQKPDVFPTLDPVRRDALIASAQGRADGNQQAAIVQAAAFKPEAASLSVGRIVAPDHAQKIFDGGIVPIESNGDNTVVSPKGALGASQIMPGTAREVAASLGLRDVAALSDVELKKRLLDDRALNLQLGSAYWRQMVTRYDGNVVLAAAAYNAGPGRADAWKAAAEAKFGANASPQEIASVVDVGETRSYLTKLYGKFGAPMDTRFSSPAATLQAAGAVGSILQQQQARETHLLTAAASAGAAADPIIDLVRAGYEVDPARIANQRALDTAAASRGDAAAAGRLRDLDFAEKVQPYVRQAWSTPPAMLDGAIKNMEAQLSAPGANVTQTGLAMVKAFQAVRDDQVKRRDTEPVTLGAENGGRYYRLEPIDPQGPLDDNLTGSLRNRDAQAQTAHRIYGGSGSPFTAQEAEGWHQRYADATPAERAAIVGRLAQGLSPRTFAAALPQVVSGTSAKADRPALAMAAGLYDKAPEVAATILQGIDAQKTDEKYVPVGTNRQAYDAARASALPAAAFNVAARTDPRGAYASMQDAIDARYAFLSAQAKDTSGNPNSARLKQAVDDVTGGVLQHNGGAVIAPARGMSQAQFDGVLWGIKDADLAGAQTTGGKPIDAEYLRSSAKLQSRSDGTYFIQVNRDDANPQYAVSSAGGPFVLDLRGRQPAPVTMRPIGPDPSKAAFVGATAGYRSPGEE